MQQLPGRNRRSRGIGVQLVEPWLQLLSRLIGHGTQRTQWVVLRNSLLRADVAEHVQLLLVFSAHASFLSGCVVETREFSGTAPACIKSKRAVLPCRRFGQLDVQRCASEGSESVPVSFPFVAGRRVRKPR